MLVLLHHRDDNRAPFHRRCRRRFPLQQRLSDGDVGLIPDLGLRDMLPGIVAGAAFEPERVDQAITVLEEQVVLCTSDEDDHAVAVVPRERRYRREGCGLPALNITDHEPCLIWDHGIGRDAASEDALRFTDDVVACMGWKGKPICLRSRLRVPSAAGRLSKDIDNYRRAMVSVAHA